MIYEAKNKFTVWIFFAFLLAITAIGWYGLWFINTETIHMEDGSVMGNDFKLIASAVMGAAVLSWTFSLVTVIRQIFSGCAFTISEEGVCNTYCAVSFLAFIFVIPIKRIPYSAIKELREEGSALVATLDKKQIEVFPAVRFLVPREYNFMYGQTKSKVPEIRSELSKYTKG